MVGLAIFFFWAPSRARRNFSPIVGLDMSATSALFLSFLFSFN
jgi:hypothetical protein